MAQTTNPFTPAFGGKPQHFFGRSRELDLMRRAFEDPNSPYRALFLTGVRGCGKTALLERLSAMADHYKWHVIDVHSSHASEAIIRQLIPYSQRTKRKSFAPSGVGFSIGEAEVAEARTYDALDLSEVLLNTCRSLPPNRGVFISVDETQKMPEHDMENICASFQMSLRKGMPVILVLAGLPQTKEKVSSFPGCTFMQRAQEIKLASLTVPETYEAYDKLLGLTTAITYKRDVVERLAELSKGHPYLMQLLGYHLVERAAEGADGASAAITPKDADSIFPVAYEAYRANVLTPSLARLQGGTLAYLKAVGDNLGDDRRASTSEVAHALGLTAQQCSPYRARLIERRILVPNGWGHVSFGLPYLDRYFDDLPLPAQPEDSWLN